MDEVFQGGQLGGNNTIVPLLHASGNLHVRVSRDASTYTFNRYSKQRTVSLPRGSYLVQQPINEHRVLGNLKWAFGTTRPVERGGVVTVEKQFYCERYTKSEYQDTRSFDVSSWDLQKDVTTRLGRILMLNRMSICMDVMNDTNQYPTDHVFEPESDISGGSTADRRINRLIMRASRLIMQKTGGAIGRPRDLIAIMNVNTATRLSESAEIAEYVMQQPNSLELLQKGIGSTDTGFGIPSPVYGANFMVDDGYIAEGVPDTDGESLTPIFPDNRIIFAVREGDLVGVEGATDYSTFTQFLYRDLTAIRRDLPFDELVQFAVTDEFDFKVTNPICGVVVDNVFKDAE